MATVYSATTWVASTAPGISAANLNNLETQWAKGVAYYNEQVSTSLPLVQTSEGVAGTSTKWSAGDHQHMYGTSTKYANSVTGGVLAHSISGYPQGTAHWTSGTIVKRAGTYHVHMVREAASAVTFSIYGNSALLGSATLTTTTEYNIGDLTFSVGDVLATLTDASPTGTGVFYTMFYNADGWW